MIHESDLLRLEVIGTGVLLLLCFVVPSRFTRKSLALEAWFSRLARKRTLSIVLVMGLALGGRLLLGWTLGVPVPAVHDEFSYRLAGETFASGRVTNPTHPMWVHFETFHVLLQPTYQSMYPPLQGLFIAVGNFIFHDPWLGVWLSAGILCGALTWAIYGWLPPKWALLGGLLSVLRIGWFSYWMNSYWGGAAAGIGGALLAGALPRIMRRPNLRDPLLMSIGVVFLANSRPYEGLVLSLAVAVFLAIWLLRKSGQMLLEKLRCVVVPGLAVLIAGGAWMGYYNWRVTGDAVQLPHLLQRRMYASYPLFLGQSPRPVPRYDHPMMLYFYQGWEKARYDAAHSFEGLFSWHAGRARNLWYFYAGPIFSVALLGAWRVLHDRRIRMLVIIAAAMLVGLAVEVWTLPHYAAPATALFYILLLQSFRHFRFRRGYPNLSILVWGVPLLCLFLAALRIGTPRLTAGDHYNEYETWCCGETQIPYLPQVKSILETAPGSHVVFVRYRPGHNVLQEWVYNAADIDGAKVVWARAMDATHDQELLRYYPQRKAWLLEPEFDPPRLVAYPRNGVHLLPAPPDGRNLRSGRANVVRR